MSYKNIFRLEILVYYLLAVDIFQNVTKLGDDFPGEFLVRYREH